MRLIITPLVALAALSFSPPLSAKVINSADNGFAVAHTAQVAATPDDVWTMLRSPDKWWSGQHSWSGDAKNLWMDMQAGGCFCETLPGKGDSTDRAARGSVQHARIIFAQPGKMLRLSGAFGPLQGEAMTGTMTVSIAPTTSGGSAIRFDYVAGGYMRLPQADIAAAVDRVMGGQLLGLAKALGGPLPVSKPKGEAVPDDAAEATNTATPTPDPELEAAATEVAATAEAETP